MYIMNEQERNEQKMKNIIAKSNHDFDVSMRKIEALRKESRKMPSDSFLMHILFFYVVFLILAIIVVSI